MTLEEKFARAAVVWARAPMLTKQDLAEHYNVDTSTILRRVRRGKLPKPIRPDGKTPYWPALDILRTDFAK